MASCATPMKYDFENISYPEIDVVTEKRIGDVLLRQGIAIIYPAIEILIDINEPEFGDRYVKKGKYIAVKKIGDDIIYEPMKNDFERIVALGSLYLRLSANGLYVSGRINDEAITSKNIDENYYNKINVSEESLTNFQQTLIYTGREGNILKATYREFYGDIARSAFTIDVTYDLNSSNIIAFRNAELVIIEATNTKIEYIVRRNFN